MANTYLKPFILAGGILGFLLFTTANLGFPLDVSNGGRDMIDMLSLFGLLKSTLEQHMPSLYHSIYISDTWNIVFPLVYYTFLGFIIGWFIALVVGRKRNVAAKPKDTK